MKEKKEKKEVFVIIVKALPHSLFSCSFRDGEVSHGQVAVGTSRRSAAASGITLAVESFRRHKDYVGRLFREGGN